MKEFPDKQWPHLALDRPLQEVDSGEGKGKMERGEGRQSEGEREGVERKRKDVKSQCYHCILETSVFFSDASFYLLNISETVLLILSKSATYMTISW